MPAPSCVIMGRRYCYEKRYLAEYRFLYFYVPDQKKTWHIPGVAMVQICLRFPRCFTNRSQFHGSSSTFTVTCSMPQTPSALRCTCPER